MEESYCHRLPLLGFQVVINIDKSTWTAVFAKIIDKNRGLLDGALECCA
jgi:hypothetical protein